MKNFIRTHKIFVVALLVVGLLWLLSLEERHPDAKEPIFGLSFSRLHTDELGLAWKDVLRALVEDLGVKHFRFSAHWPYLEPENGHYNFAELDFQMQYAQTHGVDVILAVGRRLPGWPECHIPPWAMSLSESQQQEKIVQLISQLVERYKAYPNLKAWQVENEPYLVLFARQHCGQLNIDLKEEIALVHRLDPSRPIMLTDSGELSVWHKAYSQADIFGTSMYLYIWNRTLGPLRYPIGPGFFRFKQKVVSLISGRKPSMVSELSAEPWLLAPIASTSIDVQLQRMSPDKLQEGLDFAKKTNFDTFYLWGGEWWYWLKLKGYPEMWEKGRSVFLR